MNIKNIKIKLSVLIVLAVAFFTAGIYMVIPNVRASENAIDAVRFSIGETLSMQYKVTLPSGYSSPNLIVNDDKITTYTEDDESIIFTYDVDYNEIAQDITATLMATNASGAEEQIGTCVKSPEAYLRQVLSSDKTTSELTDIEFISAKAVASNALNLAAKLQVLNSVAAEDVIKNYDTTNVFAYDNIYQQKWTERDNPYQEGTFNLEGFNWVSGIAPIVTDGVKLNFTFTVTEGAFTDLNARIYFGGQTYVVIPTLVETVGGNSTYTFTSNNVGVSSFSSKMGVNVYDGDVLLSKRALVSVNQAIDWVYVQGSTTAQQKDVMTALYSFGEAAAINACAKLEDMSKFPAVFDDDGNPRYKIAVLDYTASLYTGETDYNVWGHESSVYVGGKAYEKSALSQPVSDESYEISYESSTNTFNVNLLGGTIDGVMALYSNLNLTVSNDTVLNGALNRSVDEFNANKACTITATSGSVTIAGAKTLTLNAGIVADGDLSITDTKITVAENKEKNEGLFALGKLTLNNADITLTYNGLNKSTASSVAAKGDISITDTKLTASGYNYGIYLNGDVVENVSSQKFVLNGDSNVNVVANVVGIGSHGVNRALDLKSGKITVKGEKGIDFCNITLAEADLKVVATYGKGLGQSLPAEITTTSGDYLKGSIDIENQSTEDFWGVDVTAVSVSKMAINGGKIKMSAQSSKGILYAVTDAQITLANCDLDIVGVGYDLSAAKDGSAINAESGGLNMSIAVSARVFIENCSIPVGCWNAEKPAVLTINGDMAVTNFRAYISTWGDATSITTGSNEIRYYNQINVG